MSNSNNIIYIKNNSSARLVVFVVLLLLLSFTCCAQQLNSKVSHRLHQVILQQQEQKLQRGIRNNDDDEGIAAAEQQLMMNNNNNNIWVFFTKRSSSALLEESVLLSELDEKTIDRRRRSRRTLSGSSGTYNARRIIGRDTNNNVIIQEGDQPVDVTFIDQVVRVLKDQNHGRIRTKSKWLHAISITGATPDEIENIAQLPCVTQVEIVTQFKRPRNNIEQQQEQISLINNDNNDNDDNNNRRRVTELDYGGTFAQIQQINAIQAHNMGLNGTGLTILVLDSGFRLTHQALKSVEVIDKYDFVNNDTNVDNELGDEPNQFHHGTQCLSLIGGKYSGANPFYGVAFGAKFLLAKTEDIRDESIVEEDNFVRAIEWGEQRGADILSASLGYAYPMYTDESDFDGKTSITARAVNAATDRGLICVIAAGNDGPGPHTVATPGDAFDVITVGAVDIVGNIATFSSRGPTYDKRVKPEVCARGVQTILVNPASDTAYRAGSGTSFATPIVAGAVAVIKQAKPEWGPIEIKKALMATASRSENYDNAYGWGIINIMEALRYDNICNGNGFKLAEECKCYNSFYGSMCEYRKLSCDYGCVNGFCNNKEKCDCFPGYTGIRCAELVVVGAAGGGSGSNRRFTDTVTSSATILYLLITVLLLLVQ